MYAEGNQAAVYRELRGNGPKVVRLEKLGTALSVVYVRRRKITSLWTSLTASSLYGSDSWYTGRDRIHPRRVDLHGCRISEVMLRRAVEFSLAFGLPQQLAKEVCWTNREKMDMLWVWGTISQ